MLVKTAEPMRKLRELYKLPVIKSASLLAVLVVVSPKAASSGIQLCRDFSHFLLLLLLCLEACFANSTIAGCILIRVILMC